MGVLTEVEAKAILKKAGIKTPPEVLARTKQEALVNARRVGFPLALKIVSPDIVHKTEVGGVFLGVRDEADLERAYELLMSRVSHHAPTARIEGVLLSKLVSGVELVVGGKRDEQFGPVVMFGVGGVLVEALRDVSFRLAPLSRLDVLEMMDELRARKLLDGFRNLPPVNRDLVSDLVVRVGNLLASRPDIKELDINPVIANDKECVAVDARIVTE